MLYFLNKMFFYWKTEYNECLRFIKRKQSSSKVHVTDEVWSHQFNHIFLLIYGFLNVISKATLLFREMLRN